MAVQAQAEDIAAARDAHWVISAAIDPDFYLAVYVDVPRETGALLHYRTSGWREGRDPAPWFSVPDYLKDNPDVEAAGVEPLHHYLTQGRAEGRTAKPSRHAMRYLSEVGWEPEDWSYRSFSLEPLAKARRGAPAPQLIPPEDRALVEPEFDVEFYLKISPDLVGAGQDPLEHFFAFGAREGRDPRPDFSVEAYLTAFPEVRDSGVNPFLHYLRAGRPKVMPPEPPLGFRFEVINGLIPMEVRIEGALNTPLSPLSETELEAAFAVSRGRLAGLHITLSHDDFIAHLGGVQLAIQREAARLAEQGRDHLHLYPAASWQTVRTKDDPGAFGVIWNGRNMGDFTAETLVAVLKRTAPADAGSRSFAVHSLLGHEPDEVADVLAAAGLTAGVYWIHDFASVCAGFHLLRNDVEDCAAPPPDSAACGICLYGPWRTRNTAAHARLFERLSLTVAAPAQVTLDLWRRASGLPAAGHVVLPHATLAEPRPAPAVAPDRPFRLAYAGLPAPHKGWPIFRALAGKFAGDRRYEFIHLGAKQDPHLPIRFEHVSATPERPHAMIEALTAEAPDAVILWSLCRETFSFAAYEALAAGCAILTGPDSGNIAAIVTDIGPGRVLADEASLAAAFADGSILDLARVRRAATLHDLRYSALTLDLQRA